MNNPADAYAALRDEISTVLVGNDELIEYLTISLFTRGHVLVEGVPGVAKTTAANAFARAVGLDYTRIQMTPDVLPADITGTHVFREGTGEFQLQRGPIFSNLALADEINRATPKTQSALLEAMQENQVTIEGDTLPLPQPFMVIATQNPIEMEGTFDLPEAQRDRFQLKLVVDTPTRENERILLDRFDDDAQLGARDVEQVLTAQDVLELREVVEDVHVASSVKEYILDVVRAVREDDNVDVGSSPRAGITLLNTTKARAAIRGRDYVIPDDVKALAKPVLRHRIVLSTEADLGSVDAEDVVEDVLDRIAPPEVSGFQFGDETRDAPTADE
ncbi:MoxR family ATPase [Haloarchaeobius sp. HME9146]|uniref:AAA family ATPase n=1 Tax=Haloarchaeobius sp. HME9146 TaxID=2978732 RepID=UPI0021BFE926|nr:MoxR family ATPase [Haloarchaeobius sp. HME9146]MCT9098129.1 MoxR family ATPase [Haloarchaeobius sp. HME9146]